MIPDNEFITHEGVPGPTKEEIRCLVMCKSNVSLNDVVVDIGCGTGGLTLEFAKKAKKVYAVDKNPDALTLTRKNLINHNLEDKVQIMQADALDALDKIQEFDILMIGGSDGDLPLIIKKGYNRLKKNGRIVITSILLETRVEAVKAMLELKILPDIVSVSISKGEILERGTMMFANNPITIVTGQK